jgi:hypothetical protein
MNIPDFVSPVVAYRVWNWTPSGLTSLNGEFWLPNQSLKAKCSKFPNGHASPQRNCSCGIYAAKSLDQLRMIGFADLGVCGEVYLWGTVVEHEFGWRAQFAYPKTLVVAPESLLFGRFVQRELSTEELKFLKILTAYGADVFVAGEKENFPVWTKQSGGLERLCEVAARNVVTVPAAVLMEDGQQERLLLNGVEINHSAEIVFNNAQFPLSPTDPVLHQIQDRHARVVVIDLDRTKPQVLFHVIELIHRAAGHIAVFVKNDGVRPDIHHVVMARRWAAHGPDIRPDGWLSSHDRNDVLSAFNSLKGSRNKHWADRPPTGEANPPGVPVRSPRDRGPRSLPPRRAEPPAEVSDLASWSRVVSIWLLLGTFAFGHLVGDALGWKEVPENRSRWRLLAAPIVPSEERRTEPWLVIVEPPSRVNYMTACCSRSSGLRCGLTCCRIHKKVLPHKSCARSCVKSKTLCERRHGSCAS